MYETDLNVLVQKGAVPKPLLSDVFNAGLDLSSAVSDVLGQPLARERCSVLSFYRVHS